MIVEECKPVVISVLVVVVILGVVMVIIVVLNAVLVLGVTADDKSLVVSGTAAEGLAVLEGLVGGPSGGKHAEKTREITYNNYSYCFKLHFQLTINYGSKPIICDSMYMWAVQQIECRDISSARLSVFFQRYAT